MSLPSPYSKASLDHVQYMDDPTPWMSHLISRRDFSPRERKKLVKMVIKR